MINTLYGILFMVDPVGCSVVIECAGVGYRVQVSAGTLSKLPSPGYQPDGTPVEGAEKVRLFTYMAVREDAVDLYGFATAEELDMFKLLISVQGVGPKAGMSILSLMTPRTLAMTVAAEDTKSISRAPGVGAKTAARVVLELKEKLSKLYPATDGIPAPARTAASGTKTAASGKMADAQEALLVLGYSRSEIAAAMKHVDMEASLEEIIKKALAALMK
ncbi:MAG: Holliday junction branch migration protein RuvA [Clostridia bacterium]|nr:Holliday junction branch migration protein RuvA [Clostridia bacterium]